MKIRLTDIRCTPCVKYRNYIIDKYGADGEFDPIEVFDSVPFDKDVMDVAWLMHNCDKAQTKEMLEYYERLNPCPGEVQLFRKKCDFARKNICIFKYYIPFYMRLKNLIRKK